MISPLFRFPLIQGNDPRSQRVSDFLTLTQTLSPAGSVWVRAFLDLIDTLDTNRRPEIAVKQVVAGPRTTCSTFVGTTGYSSFPCNPPNELIPPNRVALTVADALSLLQDIVGGVFKLVSVSQALGLADAVFLARAYAFSDALGLTDSNVYELRKLVTHALSLTDSVGVNIQAVRTLTDVLAFLDTLSSGGSTHLLAQTDVMLIVQALSLVRQVNVSHAMLLVQAIQRIQPAALTQALALFEQLTSDKTNPNATPLNLAQTIGTQLTAVRAVTHTLGLVQGVMAFKDSGGHARPCADTYMPNVPLASSSNFVLTYPFVAPFRTVTLRNPKFGNLDTNDFGIIVRNNRGGEYKISRPSSWPTIEILRFSFEALIDQQKLDLINFVNESAGFEIGLRDQDNRLWRGVITTQVQELTQSLRTCAWATVLEFRGRLA